MSELIIQGVYAEWAVAGEETADWPKYDDARKRFSAIMIGDRVCEDPTDQWSHFSTPLTDTQADLLLAIALEMDGAIDPNRPGEIKARGGYTCEDCSGRWTCPLVYDAYNTNGDCLMDK